MTPFPILLLFTCISFQGIAEWVGKFYIRIDFTEKHRTTESKDGNGDRRFSRPSIHELVFLKSFNNISH